MRIRILQAGYRTPFLLTRDPETIAVSCVIAFLRHIVLYLKPALRQGPILLYLEERPLTYIQNAQNGTHRVRGLISTCSMLYLNKMRVCSSYEEVSWTSVCPSTGAHYIHIFAKI